MKLVCACEAIKRELITPPVRRFKDEDVCVIYRASGDLGTNRQLHTSYFSGLVPLVWK